MNYKTFSNHQFLYADFLTAAFKEDMPAGDITTESLGIMTKEGKAKLIAKEDLILSGIDIFIEAFLFIDSSLTFRPLFEDGDKVLNGQIVCEIKGDLIACLKAERTALNFLGMLSGIASLSRCFVDMTAGTHCKILDTRKTTPLFRDLCKKAVHDGGAKNHRQNLSDAVLIKENHIRAAGGSIIETVKQIRSRFAGPIELEVTKIEEVKIAVELGIERVMLDNMTNEEITAALKIIPPQMETEASGNMNIDRIASVAKLGVDYISVGAITHSAPVADFSLLFQWNDQ